MNAQLCDPHTRNPAVRPGTLWMSPQEVAAIRLDYEIREMVSGQRPAYRPTRSSQQDAVRTPRHRSA